MDQIKIVVAGKSEIKFSSTIVAAQYLYIVVKDDVVIRDPDSQSRISNQPHSDIEAVHGALNRALTLRYKFPDRYGVAHENTVAERGPQKWVDLAYVVTVSPSGIVAIRHSAEVPVPYELVEMSEASGWTRTCGQFEAERDASVRHNDPHWKWSGGKFSRGVLLADATEFALGAAIEAERGAR